MNLKHVIGGMMSNETRYMVTYTGKGGLSLQRKWANEHFVVGQQYEVTHGIISSSSTELYFKDIRHGWNSALFDAGEENIFEWVCMEHDYM